MAVDVRKTRKTTEIRGGSPRSGTNKKHKKRKLDPGRVNHGHISNWMGATGRPPRRLAPTDTYERYLADWVTLSRHVNNWVLVTRHFPSLSAPKTSYERYLAEVISKTVKRRGVYDWFLSKEAKAFPQIRAYFFPKKVLEELKQRRSLSPILEKLFLDLRFQVEPDRLLNEEMRRIKQFPKKRRNLPLGSRLEGFVKRQGGRKIVYETLLDEDVKALPMVRAEACPLEYMQELKFKGPLSLEEKKILLELRFRYEKEFLLNDMVRNLKAFPPLNYGPHSIGCRLTSWISAMGVKNEMPGHAWAFKYVLNEDNRKYIWVRFKAEPEKLLEELRSRDNELTREEHEIFFSLRLKLEPERALNEWIRKISGEKRFPSQSAAQGSWERRLSLWINSSGGQLIVYNKVLENDVKKMIKNPAHTKKSFESRYREEPETYLEELRARESELTNEENEIFLRLRLKLEPEKALNEWIRSEKCIPVKTAAKGSWQYKLAWWIRNYGGVEEVYDVLDDDVKQWVKRPFR